MDKAYFREYYELERHHWWFKIRARIIEDRLREVVGDKKALKILNIGAATGYTSELLSQFGSVTSLEYDEDCCRFDREVLGMEIVNGSILQLPFDENSFDLVCAFDVIEHVEDDCLAVAEMKRVCKENGIICITVPAFMQLWSHHDVVNHHHRRYVMSEVIQLFDPDQSTPAVLYKSYFNTFLFLPILLFRFVSRMAPQRSIRTDSGSDFSIIKGEGALNNLFYHIFNLEVRLLKRLTFPFGVSIILIWGGVTPVRYHDSTPE